MTPWLFVLATLAAYRVSRMLVVEEGPFSIFATIRGKIDPSQKNWIGRGVACVLCISFWITGIFAFVLGASVVEWLAMAGAIVVWREVISK